MAAPKLQLLISRGAMFAVLLVFATVLHWQDLVDADAIECVRGKGGIVDGKIQLENYAEVICPDFVKYCFSQSRHDDLFTSGVIEVGCCEIQTCPDPSLADERGCVSTPSNYEISTECCCNTSFCNYNRTIPPPEKSRAHGLASHCNLVAALITILSVLLSSFFTDDQ